MKTYAESQIEKLKAVSVPLELFLFDMAYDEGYARGTGFPDEKGLVLAVREMAETLDIPDGMELEFWERIARLFLNTGGPVSRGAGYKIMRALDRAYDIETDSRKAMKPCW